VVGPWKRGTDATAHARLIQGNADYLKNSLATRLGIAVPGPGYIHFNADLSAGFDEEFFLQLLSERKERRKRVGLITTRWVQTRERNEALDLMCMVLCILEMYRGTLDVMEPQFASEKDQAQAQPIKFGARKMIVDDLIVGGVTGFGVQRSPDQKRPAFGFGVLPGTGISF